MPNKKKIIEHYFRGQQPEETRRKFFFWLKSPISSQEKEEAMVELWEELSVPADQSTEGSYKQIEKRLGFSKRSAMRPLYLRLARIAAVFLIPVLSLLSAWLYVQDHQKPAEINLVECFVPNGEIKEIELPDKSRVIVNSGSTLFYQKGFNGKTREIYLSGEAKFTVAKDKKRPFIVKTNDMAIEALGTVFNVSSYFDNPATTATLIEGKVGVNIRSTEQRFILNPREQIVYDKKSGQILKKKTRIDYVLAWEKGQMVFQSASIQSIIKELERRHGVTVYLNTADLEDEKLTIKFLYNETLEDILYSLEQIITGFKYKIEGDKIYIN